MRFPKNKGFDLISDLVITVELEEITLIGTFLGEIEERHNHGGNQPKNVTVDEYLEFILLQLVCEVEIHDGPKIPVGTIVAINLDQILFIAPGGECDEEKLCVI